MPMVACDIAVVTVGGGEVCSPKSRQAAAARARVHVLLAQAWNCHTWYVLSNLSYMKRVMMLVLPTDWSPRKT